MCSRRESRGKRCVSVARNSTKNERKLLSTKSELDKIVDLAPAQSQMDLFLDILCARNKQRATNFNQLEEAMSRVTASAIFFQGRGD